MAPQQLFTAATGGNEPGPHFDQAHIGLGGCLNAVAMNRQFATTGQGLTKNGGDGWLRAIPQRQEKLLSARDGFVNLLPFLLPAQPEHHHQVDAGAEKLSFVGDDEGFVLRFGFRHRLADHAEHIRVERIRLGVELEASDAIAQIEQACARIRAQNVAAPPHLRQPKRSGSIRQGLLRGRSRVEIGSRAVLLAIEGLAGRRQDIVDKRRNVLPGRLSEFRGLLDTQQIPCIEYSKRPVEAGPHCGVHAGDIIGNFRNPRRRVEQ